MNNYSCPKCGNIEIAMIKTCIEKTPNGDSVCLRCHYRDKSENFFLAQPHTVKEIEKIAICPDCKKMFDYSQLDKMKELVCPYCDINCSIFTTSDYLIYLLLKDLNI
jgi:DNA-directed RNA polymerase subunit RPC12/RpoP